MIPGSAVLELVTSLEEEGWKGEGDGPLASEAGRQMLNGEWELVFQTSPDSSHSNASKFQRASIAATDGSQENRGRVSQIIDVASSQIENIAESNYFTSRIQANFKPVEGSQREVEVTFYRAGFQLGPLPEIRIPIAFLGGRGRLDTTYLSDDVRIGRGDRGTIFCLVRPQS